MNIKNSLVSVVLSTFLSVSFNGCGSDSSNLDVNTTEEHDVVHFSYSGETGPENWSTLNSDWATCENGLTLTPVETGANHQSPVDFTSIDKATQSNFTLDNNHSLLFTVQNNGHTIQLTLNENQIEKDRLFLGGNEYTLAQFHFHAASEHTEGSKYAAMEAHFVHKAADGSLAVLGAFIDANDTIANTELSKIFVAELPEEEQNGTVVSINIANILPASKVYSYSGSLTTPPCSEGVAWNVYTTHVGLSTEDVGEFKHLYPDNFRPITGDF